MAPAPIGAPHTEVEASDGAGAPRRGPVTRGQAARDSGVPKAVRSPYTTSPQWPPARSWAARGEGRPLLLLLPVFLPSPAESSSLPGVPRAYHRAQGRPRRSLSLARPVCGRRRGRGDMAGVGQAGSAAAEAEKHLNGELPPEPEDKDGAEGGAAGLGAEDGAKKKRKKKKKGKAGPAGRGRAAPRQDPQLTGRRGGLRGPRPVRAGLVGGRGWLKGPGGRAGRWAPPRPLPRAVAAVRAEGDPLGEEGAGGGWCRSAPWELG